MHLVGILISGAFVSMSLLTATARRVERCLPSGVKQTDIVSAQLARPGKAVNKITVGQKLAEMKAKCKRGKLVDRTGREIYFYRLKGCWGNPPMDYQEILQKQRDELEKLKKKYTVIEMTCNPDGVRIH